MTQRSGTVIYAPLYGGVAEWSKAAVLKTVESRGSGGSNPSSSAILKAHQNALFRIISHMSVKPPIYLPLLILFRQLALFWKGEKRLVWAFLIVGVLGLAVTATLIVLLVHLGDSIESKIAQELLLLVMMGLFFGYPAFLLKCLWSCSSNTSYKFWEYFAKGFVVIVLVYIVVIRVGKSLKIF